MWDSAALCLQKRHHITHTAHYASVCLSQELEDIFKKAHKKQVQELDTLGITWHISQDLLKQNNHCYQNKNDRTKQDLKSTKKNHTRISNPNTPYARSHYQFYHHT